MGPRYDDEWPCVVDDIAWRCAFLRSQLQPLFNGIARSVARFGADFGCGYCGRHSFVACFVDNGLVLLACFIDYANISLMAKKKINKAKRTQKNLVTRWKISLPQKPIPRVFAILVGSIVAAGLIIGFIILSIFSFRALSSSVLQHQLARDATSARVRLESSADATRQAKIDTLLKASVFDEDSSILSEKVDTCVLGGASSGWVTTSWSQTCFFEYADYLPTSHSKEKLKEALATRDFKLTFGTPGTSKNVKSCSILELNGTTTLHYLASSKESKYCTEIKKLTSGSRGEIRSAPRGESYIQQSFHEDQIDKTKAYVWVKTRFYYYASQKLECRGIVWCDSPIEKAASGFQSSN